MTCGETNLLNLTLKWRGKNRAVSSTSRLPICASGNFRLASAFREDCNVPLLFCKSSAKAGTKCSTGLCSSFNDEEFSLFWLSCWSHSIHANLISWDYVSSSSSIFFLSCCGFYCWLAGVSQCFIHYPNGLWFGFKWFWHYKNSKV